METAEKEALLYGFIDFSSKTGNSGPRELLKPILLKSINTIGNQLFSLEELQVAVEKDFGNKIDLLILKSEINKYMHQGILKFELAERKYRNLCDISEYVRNYDISARDNEYFIKLLKQYISEQTDKYDGLVFSEVFRYLIRYIENNFSEVVRLIGKQPQKQELPKSKDGIHQLIEAFIYEKVLIDKRLFSSFENIFNGIVMLFIYTNCPKIFDKENPFNEKNLYLDTNIVLRILGLQDNISNEMGREFIKYINIPSFNVFITDETWLEICSLINGYPYDYNKIIKNGRVNHVYQTMKNMNVEPNFVGDFIDQIKTRLSDMNIGIDDIIEVKYSDMKKADDYVQELSRKKHEHKCEIDGNLIPFEEIDQALYIRQSKHDIRNVFNIIYLRNGKRASHFEDENYFFVTADYILRKYSRSRISIGGQPITISDSTLAFLLYYKDQSTAKKFALNSFINAHFNSKRLSIRNWIEYYEVVKKKVEKGELDKAQAGYLLSQVILDNDKFESTGIEDIIIESVDEYEKERKEYERVHQEKNTLEVENSDIYDRLTKYENKVSGLEGQVINLQSETTSISRDNRVLKDGLGEEIKKSKKMRMQIYGISTFVFSLGIYLIFTNSKIVGFLMSAISSIIFVYEIYQKYNKK